MVDRVSLMDLAHDVRSLWCPKQSLKQMSNKRVLFTLYKKCWVFVLFCFFWLSPQLPTPIFCQDSLSCLTLGELVFGQNTLCSTYYSSSLNTSCLTGKIKLKSGQPARSKNSQNPRTCCSIVYEKLAECLVVPASVAW